MVGANGAASTGVLLRLPTWAVATLTGLAYLGLAQVILLLDHDAFQEPVFWPAAGLGVGVLLVSPARRWPWILLAIAAAEVASDLLFGLPVEVALIWAAANVGHALLAAAVIRHLHPRFALSTLREMGTFLVAAGAIGPALSATLGALGHVLVLDGSWTVWPSWWVGDGLGAVVVAPLFVALRAPAMRRSSTEITIGFLVLAVTPFLVFRNYGPAWDVVLPYLVIAPLVWSALRLGLRGAAFGVAVVGLVGGWSTYGGFGPFATPIGQERVLFELYLGVIVITTLLLAVVVSNLVERDQLQAAQQARQRELEVANDRLARALAFRDELVSMVSHELRAPLSPILGFTEVLRRDADAARPADPGALDVIQRNGERMLHLIDALLISARAAAGELRAAREPTDLGAAVIRCVDDHLHHDVEVEVATTVPVLVEPQHVVQFVINLVSNAHTYGTPPIEVVVRDAGHGWQRLEVRDHGDGVPEELVPTVFDRFTRAGADGPDPASEGVGLGLAIVRLLAEANGGEAGYDPPGEGRLTTFWVELPTAPNGVLTDRVTPEPEPVELVVDLPVPTREDAVEVASNVEQGPPRRTT